MDCAIVVLSYEYGFQESPFTIEAMDHENPFIIAYNKLKTEAEFEGAVDI